MANILTEIKAHSFILLTNLVVISANNLLMDDVKQKMLSGILAIIA
ncbi:hypothetical protein X792_04345 [Dehalococcoides mccartyi CG1]|jgi:hypothetical protein|nr:hypothetical protein GY50_0839 [Dehalococcoides mccartyi GY50]AII58692.1 hypothetical protein X792_04345 [Dehalococcoides mccartyi CG1]